MQEILSYIAEYSAVNKVSPTYREIKKKVGNGRHSVSTIARDLDTLEDYGLVKIVHGAKRCVTLIGKAVVEYGLIPPGYLAIVGVMGAGIRPEVSNPEWQPIDWLPPYKEAFGNPENVRAFRLEGCSMKDAGVFEGDIVLIERTIEFHDGDMMAVWLKNEKALTLKHCYQGVGSVRLVPANNDYQVITRHEDQVEIQGKVVGIVRLNPNNRIHPRVAGAK
jgi:SOS-response transcriptional repressor LexA